MCMNMTEADALLSVNVFFLDMTDYSTSTSATTSAYAFVYITLHSRRDSGVQRSKCAFETSMPGAHILKSSPKPCHKTHQYRT
jgi:hypothetical protein